MAIPSQLTKNNLDSGTDNPAAARTELVAAIDAINTLCTHLGQSLILSTPLGLGSGLSNVSGNIAVNTATTSISGIAPLATSSETQAGTITTKCITPAGLASLTSTTTRSGLIARATTAEASSGTLDTKAVTPLGLATAIAANANRIDYQTFTTSGTWVKPAGVSYCVIYVIGAGGGCKGTTATDGGNTSFGAYLIGYGGKKGVIASGPEYGAGGTTGGTLLGSSRLTSLGISGEAGGVLGDDCGGSAGGWAGHTEGSINMPLRGWSAGGKGRVNADGMLHGAGGGSNNNTGGGGGGCAIAYTLESALAASVNVTVGVGGIGGEASGAVHSGGNGLCVVLSW
jgi:hypothetical protein